MLLSLALAVDSPKKKGGSGEALFKPSPKVELVADVDYLGSGREEKLDLYLPAQRHLNERSPAVVLIHGGGWTSGDKRDTRQVTIGMTLAEAGYVCASINYVLAEPACWPQNLWDCKNAVRFLRKNAAKYGIDPEKIGVMGGSAGGHLALMVGYTPGVAELEPPQPYSGISNRVSAVVDLYGIANLETRQKTDKQGNPTGEFNAGSTKGMLGADLAENPGLWKQASPVTYLTKDGPPVLILHGRIDTVVDRDQSAELADRLQKLGVPHELHWLEKAGHTFDLQTWNGRPLERDLRPLALHFLDRYVRSAQPAR
jgi:acetyl esterase/lipase